MRMKMLVWLLVVFMSSVALAGCAGNIQSSKNTSNKKMSIVTTIFPIYDFTRAIVGDKATVTMLVSPGASIHSFDPSPADIKKINDSDIFIYIGGESDVWVSRILQSMDTSKIKLIRLMDFIKPVEEDEVEGMQAEEESHEHDATETQEPQYDEHIWTSPQNAVKLIDAIADGVCAVDSKSSDAYRQNAESYTSKIQNVSTEFKYVVDSAKRKKIVVADKFPFRYFVDEYGLDYRAAFSGCSDQTDASVATIAYLVNTVKNEGLQYVYYVELSNQNVARAISEQTGAGMLLLHSCHNVSKADFEKGVTYLSLMEQNVENLRKGLN